MFSKCSRHQFDIHIYLHIIFVEAIEHLPENILLFKTFNFFHMKRFLGYTFMFEEVLWLIVRAVVVIFKT